MRLSYARGITNRQIANIPGYACKTALRRIDGKSKRPAKSGGCVCGSLVSAVAQAVLRAGAGHLARPSQRLQFAAYPSMWSSRICRTPRNCLLRYDRDSANGKNLLVIFPVRLTKNGGGHKQDMQNSTWSDQQQVENIPGYSDVCLRAISPGKGADYDGCPQDD